MTNKPNKVNTHGSDSLSMSSEDYLESIYRLSQDSANPEQGVHSVDVAEQLNVSKASVNKALSALRDAGMVEQARYGRIELTKEGREYGRDIWRRHLTLRAFLEKELGVDHETANGEACMMEHALSEATMDRWVNYLEDKGVSLDMQP